MQDEKIVGQDPREGEMMKEREYISQIKKELNGITDIERQKEYTNILLLLFH